MWPDVSLGTHVFLPFDVADSVYTDNLDVGAGGVPNVTVTTSQHTPNLFDNEVGDLALGTTATQGGAFEEVFGTPVRTHFRRWGHIYFIDEDAPTFNQFFVVQSLRTQNPGQWNQRRIRVKSFLKDDMGLFYGMCIAGHSSSSTPRDFAGIINWVVTYHVVR